VRKEGEPVDPMAYLWWSRRFPSHYPLPITYYPLPITHYPLPITHYPLGCYTDRD
jgi:hypothetical protein